MSIWDIKLIPLPTSTTSRFANISGRKVALLNINGVEQPYYVSTGDGGKKKVRKGRWYPFFGFGKDGWFNKTSEEDINNYYGSPALKAGAEYLDINYPSPSGFRFKNLLSDEEEHAVMSRVNKTMPFAPRSYDDHGSQSVWMNAEKKTSTIWGACNGCEPIPYS